MATLADAYEIVGRLPGTLCDPPEVPLVAWVPELADKEALLASDPEKYFTEPHYDGYKAVLARITAFSRAELEELIIDTWRLAAPQELQDRLS